MAPVGTEWLLFAGQLGTLVVLLAVTHVVLGDYMARVYTATRHFRVERGFYRVIGADGDSEQSWGAYLRSVLAFSVVGVLVVYLFQRIQTFLPSPGF